jgi:hypothetical protein
MDTMTIESGAKLVILGKTGGRRFNFVEKISNFVFKIAPRLDKNFDG